MTYYGLLRTDAVSFMRRNRKAQDNFDREHLLAMKAFALLRAHGLRISLAGAAVEAAFPAIREFSHAGKLTSPESYKVGVRLFALRGKVRSAPLHDTPPPGAEELGRVEVDLRGIAALLPSKLSEG